LYCFLCTEADLEPRIIATRQHVYVRLGSQHGWEVETTCRKWFDHEQSTPISHGRDRQARREISQTQLLGKIYYNRAVQQLAEDRYAEAIELLEKSLRLDPDDAPARENLLAAINNWSLAEVRHERFPHAAQLLARGRELDSSYGPFQVNDLHVHQRWILALCRQNRFGEALELLEAGYGRRPEAPVFDEGRLAVYRLWAEHLLATDPARACEVLAEARRRFAADPRWLAYETAITGPYQGAVSAGQAALEGWILPPQLDLNASATRNKSRGTNLTSARP
jgi:tetratricopeptide (TPR) repeat protein